MRVSRAILSVAAVVCVMASAPAQADTGVAPAAMFGAFFEFGDEVAVAGGFTLWAGAAIYPGVDADSSGAAFFVAPGLELRTGFIPLLTGPNEVSPQVRTGIAILGPPDERIDSASSPENLTFPDLKLAAVLGYRWAFAFGLDNLQRERKDEQAFRLGVDVTSAGLLRLTDPIPVPNSLGGIVDVNHDATIDRFGFQVGFGF